MKALFLLSALSLPLLFTGCYATYVDHHPHHRAAYVERDVVVARPGYRRPAYVERDVVVTRPYRRPAYVERDVVVRTNPYQPRVEARYYNDARGRYYFKNGRRVYVNAGVYY